MIEEKLILDLYVEKLFQGKNMTLIICTGIQKWVYLWQHSLWHKSTKTMGFV